jgi:hypothetical protein
VTDPSSAAATVWASAASEAVLESKAAAAATVDVR